MIEIIAQSYFHSVRAKPVLAAVASARQKFPASRTLSVALPAVIQLFQPSSKLISHGGT